MNLPRTGALVVCLLGLAHPIAYANPTIVSPKDGAVVPIQFTVNITWGDVYYCMDDVCSYEPAEDILLWEGHDNLLDSCGPCAGDGAVEFQVMLAPGVHTLTAMAGYRESYETSDAIIITVADSEGTETSAGEASSSEGGTASSGGSPEDKAGCTCDAGHESWYGLLLLGTAWVRRPRRSQFQRRGPTG